MKATRHEERLISHLQQPVQERAAALAMVPIAFAFLAEAVLSSNALVSSRSPRSLHRGPLEGRHNAAGSSRFFGRMFVLSGFYSSPHACVYEGVKCRRGEVKWRRPHRGSCS